MTENKIKQAIKHVVELLVQGDYSAVESITGRKRIDADQMRKAITDYGRTLVAPPIDAYSKLDAVRINKNDQKKWSVRFDLWTKEEGRSDLCLVLTLIDTGSESPSVEVDGIWVP